MFLHLLANKYNPNENLDWTIFSIIIMRTSNDGFGVPSLQWGWSDSPSWPNTVKKNTVSVFASVPSVLFWVFSVKEYKCIVVCISCHKYTENFSIRFSSGWTALETDNPTTITHTDTHNVRPGEMKAPRRNWLNFVFIFCVGAASRASDTQSMLDLI